MQPDDISQLDPATAQAAGGVILVFGLIGLVFGLLMIIAMWKIFTKAGEPGWAAIIPIYNIIVLLKVIGRPVWWIVLFIIPLVNFVVAIITALDLAKSFGKSGVFAVFGLILFPFVGYPMLAFGSARYLGPAAAPPQQHFHQQPPQYPQGQYAG